MQYVKNFDLLPPNERKDVFNYLDKLYDVIKDEHSIRYSFISNSLQ